MRYHSRTPLSPRSPNLPIDHSVQRSSPTCSLSLTSVSASGKGLPDSTNSPDTMAVDPLPTAFVPASSSFKIPFPKRPHSLLRSTMSRSQTAEASSISFTAQESDEPNSAQDLDHPRKRTRTSALSTSTRSRSSRPIPPLARMSAAVSPLIVPPGGSSFCIVPPLSQHSKTHANLSPSIVSNFTFWGAQSEPKVSPSRNAITIFTGPGSEQGLSTPSNPSPLRYRRRAPTAEMRFFLHLYRTLVYGLEAKYIDRLKVQADQQSLIICDTQGTGSTAGGCGVKAKSSFDIQDALLVQHLKMYLLANGADIHLLVINVEGILEDVPSELGSDPLAMEIDAEYDSQTVSYSSCPNSVPHPHLNLSSTHSLLSYQHLIATLLMRRHTHPNRVQAKKSSKFTKERRMPSTLAECISME